MKIGRDHPDLGCKGNLTLPIQLHMLRSDRIIIVEPKHRHTGPQNIHRTRIFGCPENVFHHLRRQIPLCRQGFFEFCQCFCLRKLSFPQKISCFLKTYLSGQLINIVSAINQFSLQPQHIGQRGSRSDNSLQPFSHNLGRRRCCTHLTSLMLGQLLCQSHPDFLPFELLLFAKPQSWPELCLARLR